MEKMGLVFERFTAVAMRAITLVDRFAQLRGTRGPFPTVMGDIRFLLLARIGENGPRPFDPPLRLRPLKNPSGVYLFQRDAAVGAGPAVAIAPGRYLVRIEGDFYQPLEEEIDFPLDPPEALTLSLLPGPAYPFPDLTLKQNRLTLLRGGLFEIGGPKPIAGATVSILEPVGDWPIRAA